MTFYADNTWYKGGRVRRRRDGKGKLYLCGDVVYEGDFVGGYRQGYGILKWNEEF